MSNISRRDFMKTAGVMTLAVAASGVLAGCSTADNSTDVPTNVTSTSVTIGDWTISIKDAKLYSVTTHSSEGSKKDETKDTKDTDKFLVVLCNTKYNGDITAAKYETPYFSVEPLAKNVATDLTGSDSGDIAPAKVKKIFDLSYAPYPTFEYTNATTGKTATHTDHDYTTPTGTYFYYAYKVSEYLDGTVKTPSFALVVKDEDAITLAKLVASIPADTELKPSKVADTLGISDSKYKDSTESDT